MLGFIIKSSSAVLVVLFASATAMAQTGGNTGTNGSSAIGSSTNSSTSRSSTGTGSSANSTGGVSEFAINTENVQNAATSFVGSNSSQAFVGGVRQSAGRQATNRQFGAFQNTQNTSNSQSAQSGTPRSVRTTLKIAFAAPSGTFAQQAGVLASSNSVQLTQFSAKRPELAGINVELTPDGVAVLTGASPNVESSRLAANLVRLQPGVRRVKNQIVAAQ